MTFDPQSNNDGGTLYVVATPIGNLSDLTERARATLAEVDVIACEDTRHTQKLLQHLGLRKPLLSYHQHNEQERSAQLLETLEKGHNIALVSDAGTPLISDPGYVVVCHARAQGFKVCPIPGVSAIITALSVAGLPTDRFTFEGFLPHKPGIKRERLAQLVTETRTLVFYEAKHRIVDTLTAMMDAFGHERRACVARELTKTFESMYDGTLSEVLACINSDEMARKGEFVVMIEGAPENDEPLSIDPDNLFKHLLALLPPKKAAGVMADVTHSAKKGWYDKALAMKQE